MENMLSALSKDEEKKLPTAGCPSCKAPLISTHAFSKAEFYCLECGRACGFFEPYRLDADEVEERMAALQAEWDEHVEGKLMSRSAFWRDSCEQCGGDGKPRPEQGHWQHVTEEEIEADKEARAWLKERAGRT
jgi:hypothetical protein